MRAAKVSQMVAAVSVLLFSTAWMYPVWSDKLTRKQRAFDWVMSHAQSANPRLSRNDKEFLFLVWFAEGNLGQGRKDIVAESGRAYGYRLLYDYATQGGDKMPPSKTAFRELRKLTVLPKGLQDRRSVSFERLLVVGLRQGQTWQTYYYDRPNLPPEVQKITRLTQTPYDRFSF